MQYSNFYEFNEIGSGAYATIYTAKHKNYSEENIPQTVVLERFKSFNETLKLFITEVSNNGVVLIKAIFNLTVFISIYYNSSEIMPSVHIYMNFSLKFMELHRSRKQKST